MERFVRLIVVGGVVLVGGLWLVALLETRSTAWLAGVVLVLLGTASLAAGIASEIEA